MNYPEDDLKFLRWWANRIHDSIDRIGKKIVLEDELVEVNFELTSDESMERMHLN